MALGFGAAGASPENNWGGTGFKNKDPKKGVPTFKLPGGVAPNTGESAAPGSPHYGPSTPKAPQLPPMPFNFNMNATGAGTGGAGGGGGAGAGTGAGGGAGAPGPSGNLSEFRGSKSTELTDTFGKANELYKNAPDMLERNLMKARDAATMGGRELQQMGALRGGMTTPGKSAQLQGQLNRDLAGAAIDSAVQRQAMQQAAAGLGGQTGAAIAGDLRAQENAGINAYRATTDAWSAAQQADVARQRMGIDAQIAAMQAQYGLYNNMFNMYGNMMGNMMNAYSPYRFGY